MKREILILIGMIALISIIGVVMAVEAPTTATVTVNEFLSVSLTNAPVTFGSLNPGDTNKKPTNDPLVATIGAETNVDVDVKTKGAAEFCTNYPTCNTDKFAISYLEWDFENSFPGTGYLITDAEVCSNLVASGTCSIYHELDIPNAQKAGTYTTGITITAVKAA